MVIEGVRAYINKTNPSCKFHLLRLPFESTADTSRFNDIVKTFLAMGKSKSSAVKATKSSAVKATKDTEVKPKSSVKHGAITKSSQTPKSKSKEIAKQVALKVEKATKGDKKSKKPKKEPTPPPEPSSSESDEESASSASSDDESEAEVEVPKAAAKSNGVKANVGAKARAKVEAESSESSDSSASSESSDSDDDEVEAKTVPKPAPAAANTNGAAKASSDSEADSDDSEDSEDEVEAVPKVEAKKVLNGKPEKASAEVCNSYRRLIYPIQYQNLIFFRPHLTKSPKILDHPNPILTRNLTKRRRRKLLFRRNARLIPRPSHTQRNQRLQKLARTVARLTCLLANYPGTLMRIGSPESLANTESLLALKSLRTRRQAVLKGLHDQ